MKTCNKCGDTKPATTDNFYANKKAPCGFDHTCKICRKIINKRVYDQRKAGIFRGKPKEPVDGPIELSTTAGFAKVVNTHTTGYKEARMVLIEPHVVSRLYSTRIPTQKELKAFVVGIARSIDNEHKKYSWISYKDVKTVVRDNKNVLCYELALHPRYATKHREKSAE